MSERPPALTAAVIGRVSPHEAALIRSRAHDLDMTVSQFVRAAAITVATDVNVNVLITGQRCPTIPTGNPIAKKGGG